MTEKLIIRPSSYSSSSSKWNNIENIYDADENTTAYYNGTSTDSFVLENWNFNITEEAVITNVALYLSWGKSGYNSSGSLVGAELKLIPFSSTSGYTNYSFTNSPMYNPEYKTLQVANEVKYTGVNEWVNYAKDKNASSAAVTQADLRNFLSGLKVEIHGGSSALLRSCYLYLKEVYCEIEYEIPTTYNIEVTVFDKGGTVTGGGTYDEDTTVTLTAEPSFGYSFLYWKDKNENILSES